MISHSDFQENGEGCWIWTRTKPKQDGYAKFRLNKRHWYAHRASYTHFVGPIPEGLVIDHLCRVPSCINPEHLEAVTQKVNQRRGMRPTKLNPDKVRLMRRLDREFEITRQEIGDLFGVSETVARYAIQGKTWSDVE